MALTNIYHLRRVADTSAKACLICFKPSTSVMITPDNKVRQLYIWSDEFGQVAARFFWSKVVPHGRIRSHRRQDFFYVCPAHLQDRHFCSPVIDAESEAARLKERKMAEEIEKVKKEYEEKQQRKKEREKQSGKDEKDKDKEKKNDKDNSKDKESTDSKTNDEKERDEKVSLEENIILQDNLLLLTDLPFQIDSLKKQNEMKPENGPRVFALHKYIPPRLVSIIVTHILQDILSDAYRPATRHRDG